MEASKLAAETDSAVTEADLPPAEMTEDAPLRAPSKPTPAQIDQAARRTQIGTVAMEPATEPAEAESAEATPPAKAEAKPNQSAAKREGADLAPTAKAASHAEARAPSAALALSDVRAHDFKATSPLDLATAALQSAPSSQAGGHVQQPPPAPTAPQAPVPLAGLAVAIAANAQGGRSRFDIRLDPPELGRIDVRLHVDTNGQVTSHLIVDRSETLDLLRRDAADLERSLQQAGLKTSDQGLQFSLRDQSRGSDNNERGHAPAAQVVVPDSEATTADIVMRGYTRAGQGAGIDIRV
jgi:chemotaxis protein MotD